MARRDRKDDAKAAEAKPPAVADKAKPAEAPAAKLAEKPAEKPVTAPKAAELKRLPELGFGRALVIVFAVMAVIGMAVAISGGGSDENPSRPPVADNGNGGATQPPQPDPSPAPQPMPQQPPCPRRTPETCKLEFGRYSLHLQPGQWSAYLELPEASRFEALWDPPDCARVYQFPESNCGDIVVPGQEVDFGRRAANQIFRVSAPNGGRLTLVVTPLSEQFNCSGGK